MDFAELLSANCILEQTQTD